MWSGLEILNFMLGNMSIYFKIMNDMIKMVLKRALIIMSQKLMAEVMGMEF